MPEGSLAGNFRVGFRTIFGQTWPPNPSRTTGLVLQCRLHKIQARRPILRPFRGAYKNPARLPSGTQRSTSHVAWYWLLAALWGVGATFAASHLKVSSGRLGLTRFAPWIAEV